MKTLILPFFSFSIIMSFCINSHAGLLDTLGDLVTNNKAKISIKVPVDDLAKEANADKWLKPSLGYEFQFMNYPGDPSKYLRKETLNLRLRIPLALQDSLPMSMGPSLKSQFIRPFEKGDLKKIGEDFISDARPYLPTQAPHTPKKALALTEGDYYSFVTNMSFRLSPGTAMLQGIAFAGAHASYIVSGDFKIDVYRLAGTKVKVVASSLRQKSVGFHAQAKLVPDIEVFAIDKIDKIINKQLEVRLMDWNFYQKTIGNLFSVSYTYDLSEEHPEARRAYNHLCNSLTWKRPKLVITNPKVHDPEANERQFWLANIESSRDATLLENTGVHFNDESEMDYIQTSQGVKFDLVLAGLNHQKHFMEIDYNLRKTPMSPIDRYRIASLTLKRDGNFAFKLREYKTTRTATVIFGLDEETKIKSFDEITLSYERSDSKLTLGKGGIFAIDERPAIRGQLRKMLPESLHYWEDEMKKKFNPQVNEGSFILMEINYSPEALGLMTTLNPIEIGFVVDAFVDQAIEKLSSGNTLDHKYFGVLELADALKSNGGKVENFFSEQKLNPIKEGLSFIFAPNHDKDPNLDEKRWDRFEKLKSNIVFRDFGSAFLVRMLELAALKNGRNVEDFINFRMRYKSESKPEASIVVGDFVRPEYTQALLRDRNRVLNREYNPAHFAE